MEVGYVSPGVGGAVIKNDGYIGISVGRAVIKDDGYIGISVGRAGVRYVVAGMNGSGDGENVKYV